MVLPEEPEVPRLCAPEWRPRRLHFDSELARSAYQRTAPCPRAEREWFRSPVCRGVPASRERAVRCKPPDHPPPVLPSCPDRPPESSPTTEPCSIPVRDEYQFFASRLPRWSQCDCRTRSSCLRFREQSRPCRRVGLRAV